MTLDVSGHRLGNNPRARLLDAAGVPVVGARIVFWTRHRERTCVGFTNSAGAASCSMGKALVAEYEAIFAGDALHDAARAQTWITRR